MKRYENMTKWQEQVAALHKKQREAEAWVESLEHGAARDPARWDCAEEYFAELKEAREDLAQVQRDLEEARDRMQAAALDAQDEGFAAVSAGQTRLELEVVAAREMDPERARWLRDLCEGRPGWAETAAAVLAHPEATQEAICARVRELTGVSLAQSSMSDRLAAMEKAWASAHPTAGPLFPNRRRRRSG